MVPKTGDVIILNYAKRKFSPAEISSLLLSNYQLTLGKRMVQKVLKRIGFKRKFVRSESEIHELTKTMRDELPLSSNLGYRMMKERLKVKYDLNASSYLVQEILREIDPDGVEKRRRRTLVRRSYSSDGPGFLVHIDGYDKLKPYGFAIHGAIDGFSRKLLWLTVGVSNNNPAVVLGHYLKCVKEMRGLPRMLRADKGTENGLIATTHITLHSEKEPAELAQRKVIFGSSTSNQRIERFWGNLRKSFAQLWMDIFQKLVMDGLFNKDDEIHQDALRFSFMLLIREQLDGVLEEWNGHMMRSNKKITSPTGKPVIMWNCPHMFGNYRRHLSEVSVSCIDALYKEFVEEEDLLGVTEDVKRHFEYIIELHHIPPVISVDSGLSMYRSLISKAQYTF